MSFHERNDNENDCIERRWSERSETIHAPERLAGTTGLHNNTTPGRDLQNTATLHPRLLVPSPKASVKNTER